MRARQNCVHNLHCASRQGSHHLDHLVRERGESSNNGPGNGVISRAVCAVLPEEGLIVRDQPNLENSRIIGSIRPGNYTFQFTRDRRTMGQQQRQWAYITAPAKGWISTGIVGDGSNLAGEGCS